MSDTNTILERFKSDLQEIGIANPQPWLERFNVAAGYVEYLEMKVLLLQPGTKKPYFSSWNETADVSEVAQQLTLAARQSADTLQPVAPGAEDEQQKLLLQVPNVGVVPTGLYAIVDVDTPEQRSTLYGAFPDMPPYTVTSPGVQNPDGTWEHSGGGHIYLRVPEEHRATVLAAPAKVKLPGGAEVRLHGCYTLGVMSTRAEGRYGLGEGQQVNSPYLVPEAVLDTIGEAAAKAAEKSQRSVDPNYDPADDPVRQWEAATVAADPDTWAATVLGATRAGEKYGWPCYNLPGRTSGSFSIDMSQGARVHFWTDNAPEEVEKALTERGENRSIGAASVQCAMLYQNEWNAFLHGEGLYDAYMQYRASKMGRGARGFGSAPQGPIIVERTDTTLAVPGNEVNGTTAGTALAIPGTAEVAAQAPGSQVPALLDDDDDLDLPRFPRSAQLEALTATTGEPTSLDEYPQTFAKFPEEHAKLVKVWDRHCERVDDLVRELEESWGCTLPDESVLALRTRLWPEQRRRDSKPPQWSEVPGPEREAKYGHDGFPVDPQVYVALMNASPLHQAVFWNVRENHKNASILGALARENQEVAHRLPVGYQCSERGNTQPPNIFVALVSQSGGGKTATQGARTFEFAEEHLTEVREAAKEAAAQQREAQEQQEQQIEALRALKEKMEDGKPTKAQQKEKVELEKELKALAPRTQDPLPGAQLLGLSLGEGQAPGSAAAIRQSLTRVVETEDGRNVLKLLDKARRYYYWDEAVSMTNALGAGDNHGSGSGVDTTLSSLWNGRPNFTSTQGQGEVEAVPENFHGVRVAVTLAIQTKKSQGLLDTVGQGFLQRFLRIPTHMVYEAAITPNIVARPNKVHPQVRVVDVPQDGRVTWGKDMRRADNANALGAGLDTDEADEGNSHAFGHVMRMAAVHAAMNGRQDVGREDYIVGKLWEEISRQTLKWVIHQLAVESDKEAVAKAKRELNARKTVERVESQDNERVWRKIYGFLQEAEHAWHTRKDIRDAIKEPSDIIDVLVKKGCSEGVLTCEERPGYTAKNRSALRFKVAARADDQAAV